ncbi:hypothetical protein MHYP_G00079650 [Metynnis hypsauchen]
MDSAEEEGKFQLQLDISGDRQVSRDEGLGFPHDQQHVTGQLSTVHSRQEGSDLDRPVPTPPARSEQPAQSVGTGRVSHQGALLDTTKTFKSEYENLSWAREKTLHRKKKAWA